MTTPVNPDEKKEQKEVNALTLEERVGRLEIVLENAFNLLSKSIKETELRLQDSKRYLETDIARSLHMMNLTTLQNIITIRELANHLVGKQIVDGAELEEKIRVSLEEAIAEQTKAIEEANANAQKALDAQAVAEAPQA